MDHLLSLVLLVLLVPQNQKQPPAFQQLPQQVRERATVIFTATFREGRSPCIFMPDGTRRWALESRFQIKKVYQGKVGGQTIYLNSRAPEINKVNVKLEAGHDYLVLLRPNEESMKVIKAGEYVPVWDALHDDEIVAIVELTDLHCDDAEWTTGTGPTRRSTVRALRGWR
jgi:hypothetical protein